MKISNCCLTSVLASCTPQWNDRVGEISNEYWEQQKLVISSDNFAAIRNSYAVNAVQRITRTVFHMMSTNNQFADVRSGDFNMGAYIQEMGFTNLLQAHQYKGVNVSADEQRGGEYDQFRPDPQQVKVCYHTLNRQEWYRTTLKDVNLRQAFAEEGALQQWAAGTIDQLYRSDEWDTELYCKKSIVDAARSKDYPLLDGQVLEMPDITSETSTVADIRIFIFRLRTLLLAMARNNQCYNAMGRPNVVPDNQISVWLDMRCAVQNEIQNLSIAFNPQYQTYGAAVKEINNFGVDDMSGATDISDNILGVVNQKGWLSCLTTFKALTQAQDAIGVFQNMFHHCHEMYRACPFMDAVYLVKDKKKFLQDIQNSQPVGKTFYKDSATDEEVVQNDKEEKAKGKGR